MKLFLLLLLLLAASSALATASAEENGLRWGDDASCAGYPSPLTFTPSYAIPDLMTFLDGAPVETPEDWARRRAEIRGLYEYYMYGVLPDGSEETLTWRTEGPTLHITVGREGREITLSVPFRLPEGEAPEGGWPYYIEYSFRGPSPAAQHAVTRGYAAFAYAPCDVAADNTSRTGLFYTLYPYGGTPSTQTGVLSAWAWGVAKIIDALEDGAAEALHINPAYSIVGGVSRFGKSAAVAGAFDERIMFVVPSCSGAGGLSMFRYSCEGKTFDLSSLGYVNADGNGLWVNGTCESFSVIRSSSERHWFNENFRLTPTPHMLPFDQHFLAALCAAENRHYILVTGVISEAWNNVGGQVMAVAGAQPAWELLGAGENNRMIVHLDGHAILESDMALILDYADQVLYGKTPARDLSVMMDNLFLPSVQALWDAAR